jgi:hypothetical protein
MKQEFFREIKESFRKYAEWKSQFDSRIIENTEWLDSQMRFSKENDEVAPTTAFVFNAIANKHADAMDNFPEPNILPRHEEDEEEAKSLSKIIPVQLEMSGFRRVYSRNWWVKLKHGGALYGVFFNSGADGGMGEVAIKDLNLLNVFWEPCITDLQESRFLFITSFVRTDELKQMYPKKNITSCGDEAQIKRMRHIWDEEVYRDKSLVVDCYYKVGSAVHMAKFTGDILLDSTEDRGMATLYDHGLYPVVADPLFASENSLFGAGFIDIMKNPQEYINKMDSIISKNAFVSGKVRFIIKDNGGINEHELTDLSSDIIHAAGSVGEDSIRQFQASPLDSFIISHRKSKITELKEIAGNRDFQQGGASNGVTAYSAISALQQAGEKLSRDMIYESYEAYRQIILMCVEIIRQFYFEPRFFRCRNDMGKSEYIVYSNGGLAVQEYGEGYRRPEFDVEVSVQKNSPYSKAEQNETAKQLYKLGVFDPNNAQKSMMLVELMQFEGKAKVLDYLKKIAERSKQENGENKQSGTK